MTANGAMASIRMRGSRARFLAYTGPCRCLSDGAEDTPSRTSCDLAPITSSAGRASDHGAGKAKRLRGFQIEALIWIGRPIGSWAGLAPRRGFLLEREGHGDGANTGGRRLPNRAISSARARPGPHCRRPISAERLAGLGNRLSRTSRLVNPGVAAAAAEVRINGLESRLL